MKVKETEKENENVNDRGISIRSAKRFKIENTDYYLIKKNIH